MRPRQPFDFANRTGTITFDVDAVTQGGLSWWPSVFITDQPTAGADDASQVLGLLPRNGIGIDFTGQQCNNAPPKTEGAVGNVFTYSNYVQTDITNSNAVTSNPCYATRTGSLNHFEVSLSQSQVTVWASDYSTNDGQSYPNFKEVFSAAINLSFSQGYVFFQTAERAPVKYASQFNISPGYANYYWSDLGFDGPVVSTGEKGYSLPDALTVDPNSSNGEIPLNNALNVGYGLLNNPTTIATCCNKGADTDLSSFNIPGVNLNGVNSAYLSFDVDYTYISPGFTTSNVNLHYSLNGGPWLDPDPEPDYVGENTCSNCPGPVGGGEVAYNFPVPLADLINGTNTLNFSVPGSNNGYPPILTSLDLLTFTTSSPP
jgi:hypothetical protein